jgi:hypothetical protein
MRPCYGSSGSGALSRNVSNLYQPSLSKYPRLAKVRSVTGLYRSSSTTGPGLALRQKIAPLFRRSSAALQRPVAWLLDRPCCRRFDRYCMGQHWRGRLRQCASGDKNVFRSICATPLFGFQSPGFSGLRIKPYSVLVFVFRKFSSTLPLSPPPEVKP